MFLKTSPFARASAADQIGGAIDGIALQIHTGATEDYARQCRERSCGFVRRVDPPA